MPSPNSPRLQFREIGEWVYCFLASSADDMTPIEIGRILIVGLDATERAAFETYKKLGQEIMTGIIAKATGAKVDGWIERKPREDQN